MVSASQQNIPRRQAWLKPPTYERLRAVGQMGDSANDVISRLLDAYEFCLQHHSRRRRQPDTPPHPQEWHSNQPSTLPRVITQSNTPPSQAGGGH